MSSVDVAFAGQQVVEQFFRALRDGRWLDAATLVDPAATDLFRERQLAALVSWAQNLEAMKAWREKAEGGSFGWAANGTVTPEALASTSATTLASVPGLRTLGDLAALPATVFLAKYLEVSNSPTVHGAVAARRVLGGIHEGDSVVHVLYRNESPEITYSEPYHVDHLRLKRMGNEWLVDLWGDPEFASGHDVMRLADDFFASMPQGEDLGSDV